MELFKKDLLDIRSDVAFKHFFSDKALLEHFINDVLLLKGDRKITICEFLHSRLNRFGKNSPVTYVDILAKTGAGERTIIEMQRYYDEYFDTRVLYYLARDFASHLRREEKNILYGHLPKMHVITVTAFDQKGGLLKGRSPIETFNFKPEIDPENIACFKQWRVSVVDLIKYDYNRDGMDTRQKKWFYFMQHSSSLPANFAKMLLTEPIFKDAIKRLEAISADAHVRAEHDREWKFLRDHESSVAGAFLSGADKGKKEEKIETIRSMLKGNCSEEYIMKFARASLSDIESCRNGALEGIYESPSPADESYAYGKTEGKKEGKEEEKREIICNMLKADFSDADIIASTKASLSDIDSCRNSMLEEISESPSPADEAYTYGKTEGKEEGKEEEKREIICNMLKADVSDEDIMKFTGVSLSDIDSCKNSIVEGTSESP